MIYLRFTLPPSVNIAYAWKDIRYKSDPYKKWEEIADLELRKQLKYEIIWDEWLTAKYTLHIDLFAKNGSKRIIDVANYEKCMSDFLWGHVDPITRKSLTRTHKDQWVQRLPWFKDHKIKINTQLKVQKDPWAEDWMEVEIDELQLNKIDFQVRKHII